MKYEIDYQSVKYSVGTIYPSTTGEIIILGKDIDSSSYIVKFLNTGTVAKASSSTIKCGNVKDRFFPIVFGVGYLGNDSHIPSSELRRNTYRLWTNLLRRCYGVTYDRYGNVRHTYADVTVCKEWHNFSLFFESIKKVEGYKEWLTLPEYEIDKDKSGYRLYSEETCCFIPRKENAELGHVKQRVELPPIHLIDTKAVIVYVSDYTKFSNSVGIKPYEVIKLIRGTQAVMRGWRVALGTEVYYFDDNGTEVSCTSLTELAKKYNTMTSAFWKLIRGETTYHKGVTFKYSRTIKINDLN